MGIRWMTMKKIESDLLIEWRLLASLQHAYQICEVYTTQTFTFQTTRWNKSNHQYFIDSSISLDEFSCRKLFTPHSKNTNTETHCQTGKQANRRTGHRSAHHIRNNSILTTAFPTANYQSKFFLPEFVVLVENTRTYITLYPQIHAHSANTKRQYCHLPFVVVVHSRERLLRTIRKRCLLCTHWFGLVWLLLNVKHFSRHSR